MKSTHSINPKKIKPLCKEDGCPSILDKSIIIGPYIEGFIDLQIKNNPNATPQCIKREVFELLKKDCDRLFFELTVAKEVSEMDEHEKG